jgi:putative multiple sugar transport system substrate-binding protein
MKVIKFAAALAFGVLAAAASAQADDKPTIGISMPTKSSARWAADMTTLECAA